MDVTSPAPTLPTAESMDCMSVTDDYLTAGNAPAEVFSADSWSLADTYDGLMLRRPDPPIAEEWSPSVPMLVSSWLRTVHEPLSSDAQPYASGLRDFRALTASCRSWAAECPYATTLIRGFEEGPTYTVREANTLDAPPMLRPRRETALPRLWEAPSSVRQF